MNDFHRLTKMTTKTLVIMMQMITMTMMIMTQMMKVPKMPLTRMMMMMMMHSKQKMMTMMIMMPTMMMKRTLPLVSVFVLFNGHCWIICAIFKLINESESMKMRTDFQIVNENHRSSHRSSNCLNYFSRPENRCWFGPSWCSTSSAIQKTTSQ